jgi:hypothetical protein
VNCQIVHDSIHRRDGWTVSYMLNVAGVTAGFGSIAVAGPWKDKTSIFEFYVLPEYRVHSFELFEALLTASNARFMEIQSSDVLLAVMLHTYARDIWSEKIVFRDAITTALPANGVTVQQLTPDQETWNAIAQRQGGAEYQLVLDGATVAPAASCFTTTCRTRTSTWRLSNASGATVLGRIWSRSSNAVRTRSGVSRVPAAIPATSHHAKLFRRRVSSRSRTFSTDRSATIDERSGTLAHSRFIDREIRPTLY